MSKIVEVNVQSEIGKLNGVILHTPRRGGRKHDSRER